MGIPEEKINDIQDRLDMVDVVGEYVQLKKNGSRYIGLCPFHNEKTPSFSVNREKKLFYCFGCGKGGTLFTFIMEMEKLSFVDAVKLLAKKAGIEINDGYIDPEEKVRTSLKGKLQDLYERTAGSYHFILTTRKEGKRGLLYLEERGVGAETMEEYSLGFAPSDPEWLYAFLSKHGYSDEFLSKSGLFTQKNQRRSLFTGRIVFPITDMKGRTIAFGGRIIDDNGPKYLNSPDTPIYRKKSSLYGLSQALESIRKQEQFIIVEGYLDVLAMHQAGIYPVVAPLGTSLTKEQLMFLRRFAHSCLLVFDGDEAGAKAARRAGALCEEFDIESSIVALPEGKDPADILKKDGSEALQNLMKYPINSFEYLVKRAAERYRIGDSGERSAILQELYTFISSIGSEVRKEECLKYLADELGLGYHSVTGDFIGSQSTLRVKEEDGNIKRSRDVSFDLFLLLAVTEHRSYFPFIRSRLSPDDFEDKRGKELFIALEESFRREETSMEKLLEKIQDGELRDIMLERINREEFTINVDSIIHDGVEKIKKRSLIKKRDSVELALRRIKTQDGGLDEERKLIAEKQFLDEELSRYKG